MTPKQRGGAAWPDDAPPHEATPPNPASVGRSVGRTGVPDDTPGDSPSQPERGREG